jgi:transposase
MSKTMDCTDAQWEAVKDLLSPIQERTETRGRKPLEAREVFNGVLWICRTGARWQDLPPRYPPYQSCHRYFQRWCQEGVWDKVLWALAKDLKRRGKIDITECFIDGTFSSAKKGGSISARLSEVKAPRSWSSQTLLVFLSPYGPSEPVPTK